MNNIDTILQYLMKKGILTKQTLTRSFSKQSAGAAGYFGDQISLDFTPLFFTVTTSDISNSKGLQLTPVCLTPEIYYINYYSPNTMSAAIPLDNNILWHEVISQKGVLL